MERPGFTENSGARADGAPGVSPALGPPPASLEPGGMKLLDTPPGPAHFCPRAPRGDLERKAAAGRPLPSRPAVTTAAALVVLPEHHATKVSPGSDAGGHRAQRPRLLEEPKCEEKGVLQPPTSVNVENIRN